MKSVTKVSLWKIILTNVAKSKHSKMTTDVYVVT